MARPSAIIDGEQICNHPIRKGATMSTSTLKQPPYTYDIVGSFLRPERLKN